MAEPKNTYSIGENVLETVVSNNLCVGCGMCAGIFPKVLRMYTDKYGAYLPELAGEVSEDWGKLSLKVCPFADNQENEDTLAAELFSHQKGIKHRSETGYYLKCFTGHVTNQEERLASTSGGIITWLAGEMLRSGKVDGVACVGQNNDEENLFEFQLITDSANLSKCRKARYYPVEVSGIIRKIKEADRRILFIGLPCFLKALRFAMKIDHVLKERIVYTIGLFCGHLKTKRYTAYLAKSCGVNEKEIKMVNFRKKVSGRPASKYAFEVFTWKDGTENYQQIMMEDVWASKWSYNLFMLDACEYCDDIMAETADVSLGDAWLQECVNDYRGTNIIVCRQKDMIDVLNAGVDVGELSLKETSIERVIQSQAGCIRQRRQGLQYRLYLSAKKGQWRPRKRVTADHKAGTFCYRLLQLLRIKTKALSREAFLKQQQINGLHIFVRSLRFWILMERVLNFIRQFHGIFSRKILNLWKVLRKERNT
jgi:coenzyme F420-reducing hydrogenase beta subunit